MRVMKEILSVVPVEKGPVERRQEGEHADEGDGERDGRAQPAPLDHGVRDPGPGAPESRNGHPSSWRVSRTVSRGTSKTTRNRPISGARTKGTRPFRDFLSRPSASSTVAGAAPEPRTGRPDRAEQRHLSARGGGARQAQPLGEPRLGGDAQRHRLAVRPAGEPGGRLHGVPDGVAVVEHRAQLGLLLVALHHMGLEAAGARHHPGQRRRSRARAAGRGSPRGRRSRRRPARCRA